MMRQAGRCAKANSVSAVLCISLFPLRCSSDSSGDAVCTCAHVNGTGRHGLHYEMLHFIAV
jgi:hypothetical protein